MRGTGCLSDHRLIRCTLSLRLARCQRHTNTCSVKRLDTAKLHQSAPRSLLFNNLDTARQVCHIDYSNDVELSWSHLKDVCYSTASDPLGYRQNVHRDWFDENDQAALQLINQLRTAHLEYVRSRESPSKKCHTIWKSSESHKDEE